MEVVGGGRAPCDGSFAVSVTMEGGDVVVAVHGEVDLATAETLRAAIAEALAADGRVVFDLTGVTFLDSTGLAAIAGAFRARGRAPGALAVRGASGSVLRTLSISGIDALIDMEP